MNMTTVGPAHRTGSDLVAEFIARRCSPEVFLVIGGAAAFMIDALGRHDDTSYVCVQHEQSAAMAADAIWRTTGRVGVTMATSGPGATNLVTGIASSWFDSIPSLHITGQVNDRESRETVGALPRQAGFQETDIVAMVTPITKYAVKVATVRALAEALDHAVRSATTGRMGPVLIDVPMNVQQDLATEVDFAIALGVDDAGASEVGEQSSAVEVRRRVADFLADARRPLVVMGGGLGLAGTARAAQEWCERVGVPYIASWAGMTYFDRAQPGYQGTQGVYGVRHANWTAQAADKILVLGSRLDNRQRTGNPRAYAPFAEVLVLDVDGEEIRKFQHEPNYAGMTFDLRAIGEALEGVTTPGADPEWRTILRKAKEISPIEADKAVQPGELNPYHAVAALQASFPPSSIVISDTGANLCWTFQAYEPDDSLLFTSGGNSPMGYSLPAAIGAQIASPDASVVCLIGDGGVQMNIQELQTAVAYDLPITIVIFNNAGYGIIKQFQDVNMAGRYHASGTGYTTPDFQRVVEAYGIEFQRVRSVDDLTPGVWERRLRVIELVIPPNALIVPKAEGNRFIHEQFPQDGLEQAQLPFDYPATPADILRPVETSSAL